MILLIDNFDSFTFNLHQYVEALGAQTLVLRNNRLAASDLPALNPEAIILSPGPGRPENAGNSPEVARAALSLGIPLLGICLGHQLIAQCHGATITQADVPVHGKVDTITHHGSDLFGDLPSPMRVTRYHSLIISKHEMPDSLEITAETANGEVMGIACKDKPAYGVQFHPEALLSEHGHSLLSNFLQIANITHRRTTPADCAPFIQIDHG